MPNPDVAIAFLMFTGGCAALFLALGVLAAGLSLLIDTLKGWR